jgi:hypothetical protein
MNINWVHMHDLYDLACASIDPNALFINTKQFDRWLSDQYGIIGHSSDSHNITYILEFESDEDRMIFILKCL